MNHLLEDIFKTRQFLATDNKMVTIAGETSKEQCEYLQQIIIDNGFKNSIEIGFAYGMSTLAISEEIIKNGGSHLVIDKFQYSMVNGYGLDLMKQSGYIDKLEFIEEYCYIALPKLLENGRTFDFAYVDSTKQFDWLLVDFFYIDKLLKVGGIVTFDDVTYPGIRKLFRYLSQFPSYRLYSQYYPNAQSSKKRRAFEFLRYLPGSKRYIKSELIKSDFELGVNSHCISLQKMEEDNRSPFWHVDF